MVKPKAGIELVEQESGTAEESGQSESRTTNVELGPEGLNTARHVLRAARRITWTGKTPNRFLASASETNNGTSKQGPFVKAYDARLFICKIT